MGSTGARRGVTARQRILHNPQNPATGVQGVVQGAAQPQQQQPNPQPQPQQPTPPVQQTQTTVDSMKAMTDDELAKIGRDSRTAQLPNQLADVADQTQRFVFTAGLNTKPQLLDASAYAAYKQANPNLVELERASADITYKNPMGTTIKMTGQQTLEMLKKSRFNYIGGKVGGQALGAGTYMQAGSRTGFSGAKAQAVLNMQTARVITVDALRGQASAFMRSHPKFVAAVGRFSENFHGNNMSIYATAMGYNVVTDRIINGQPDGRTNIIDRAALIFKE